jgi:hypothetical protein
MPGRIALRDAPGAFDELVDTSGAEIEELFAWATGAAIFSDGRTVGRWEFTIAEAASGLTVNEFAGAVRGTAPDFWVATEFCAAAGLFDGCEFAPVGVIPGWAAPAGAVGAVANGGAAETELAAPSLWVVVHQ